MRPTYMALTTVQYPDTYKKWNQLKHKRWIWGHWKFINLDFHWDPYYAFKTQRIRKLLVGLWIILALVRRHLIPFCLQVSFELSNWLDKVWQNYSLDVDSLFTRALIRETVDFCDFISSHNFRLFIPVEYIEDLVLLYTENTRFNVEEKAFNQTDGAAMEVL